MKSNIKLALPILLLVGLAWPSSAQTPSWDRSGNGLLKGNYNFRQIYFEVGDDAGNFSKNVAIWGSITFDGSGNYTLANVSVLDSRVGSVKPLALMGTYAISASGFGFMDNPALKGALVFGLVSKGIFIASTTEDIADDLFIAVPAPANTPTLASFNGRYWLAEMNFPSLTAASARDAQILINPNGQGGLGSVSLTAYSGASGTGVKQTIGNASYSFSANKGTISWGTSSTAVNGNRILYLSPDGNFIFGGSTTSWDIFVGVRAFDGGAPASAFSGLYYAAGIDLDNSFLTSESYSIIDNYYGAFSAVPDTGTTGNIVGHQRVTYGFPYNLYPDVPLTPTDYTYSDTYVVASDGSHDDSFGFHNILGAGGAIQIGFGTQTYLGISISLKAPSFSGTGVFISPVGVVNAANYSPFTVGVSPGGLVRIFGSNLAAVTSTDTTFPKTLAGVQVLMNNRQAPVYFVSPGQIVAVVPWGTSENVVRMQVINNGTASNAVTVFVAAGTPGVFTDPPNGIGDAAALHSNGAPVATQNPARAGETIAVYMTGLGRVTPPLADGAAGAAAEPFNRTSNDSNAYVDGLTATLVYSGLAPGLTGLYQMNITIPKGVTPGRVLLEIGTVGALNSQASLQIGGATGAGIKPSPESNTSRRIRVAQTGHRKESVPSLKGPQ